MNSPIRYTKPFGHLLKRELEDAKNSCQVCVVSAGPDHKKSYPLIAGKTVKVGYDPSNHLTLTDDYVSGFHLELELREGQVHVRHLSKTNPTLIHGKSVHSVGVKEETEISIGRSRLRLLIEKRPYWENIVGGSPKMVETYQQILNAAERDETVLILGETGVGKEVAANAIHWLSPRFSAPCLVINCAVLSEELMVSELFGYEKGSHAMATDQKAGCFEAVQGGTLFLDEIGELSLKNQAKLLRVLQERKIRRIGGTSEIPITCRVITATNRNLDQAVNEGAFRQDLLSRLDFIRISVLPLRARKEDIPDLVHYFLKSEAIQPTSAAVEKLKAYSWPSNIRELQRVLGKAVAQVKMRGGDTIEISDIEVKDSACSEEENEMQRVLNECFLKYKKKGPALEEAAKHLGIKTSTLYAKIKQWKLNW